MNDYKQQAADFLAKHNIQFSAKLANKKLPSWKNGDARKNNHFVVTLKKDNQRISFDFFDSENNFRAGIQELDAYSVLSCCSSEFHCPDTFEDFCSEYGYDAYDAHTGKKNQQTAKTFNALKKQSDKLKKFFDTVEMVNDLMEIA